MAAKFSLPHSSHGFVSSSPGRNVRLHLHAASARFRCSCAASLCAASASWLRLKTTAPALAASEARTKAPDTENLHRALFQSLIKLLLLTQAFTWEAATAQATVMPTIGLLPAPIRPIIST